jgi:hypothetical protein
MALVAVNSAEPTSEKVIAVTVSPRSNVGPIKPSANITSDVIRINADSYRKSIKPRLY